MKLLSILVFLLARDNKLYWGDAGTILAHWKTLLAIWVGINFVLAMPSPAETGPTSHWLYKWSFTALHGIAGAVPRLAATLFPQLAKFIPGMGASK